MCRLYIQETHKCRHLSKQRGFLEHCCGCALHTQQQDCLRKVLLQCQSPVWLVQFLTEIWGRISGTTPVSVTNTQQHVEFLEQRLNCQPPDLHVSGPPPGQQLLLPSSLQRVQTRGLADVLHGGCTRVEPQTFQSERPPRTAFWLLVWTLKANADSGHGLWKWGWVYWGSRLNPVHWRAFYPKAELFICYCFSYLSHVRSTLCTCACFEASVWVCLFLSVDCLFPTNLFMTSLGCFLPPSLWFRLVMAGCLFLWCFSLFFFHTWHSPGQWENHLPSFFLELRKSNAELNQTRFWWEASAFGGSQWLFTSHRLQLHILHPCVGGRRGR